ncbi:major facilitator superfamily transporter [Colletotrichum eremochloae]|nr:major facilitator superfamily transporter [Colletotrichum eremochloae]
MSLAHHVTQAEGYDCERPKEQAEHDGDIEAAGGRPQPETTETAKEPKWKHMSFTPVKTGLFSKPLAAYKVSHAKRWLQVATGIVGCCLAAGLVFGFAALKPVLIKEGVYRQLCGPDDPGSTEDGEDVPCTKQDLRLNLFFIGASVTTNVSSLIAGFVLDRYGRRGCWVVSSTCLSVGCLLMATSDQITGFDGYFLGNTFLALGGTFLFVSSFQLAHAFPKHSGIIIALVTGAFDASAAVFLLYRTVYEASDGKVSLKKFFFSYLSIPFMLMVAEFGYMPIRSYHTKQQLEDKIQGAQDETRDVHESDEEIEDAGERQEVQNSRTERRLMKLDQIEEVAGNAEYREERQRTNQERQQASGVWGVLHGVPAHKQIQSPWFILILLLTIVQMLKMNYFIATIKSQYRYILGSEAEADAINRFFDVALPIGGLVSTPFIGVLLNKLSVTATFAILTALVIAIGALNYPPFGWAGYATVALFVIFRPLYYSAISDYATKVFGFATFGRIYGTIVCVSGLVNFAQSGLDSLTHGPLRGDPTLVNVTLGGAGAILGIILTVFLAIKGRSFVKQEKAVVDARQERERLLQSATQDYGSRQ